MRPLDIASIQTVRHIKDVLSELDTVSLPPALTVIVVDDVDVVDEDEDDEAIF